MEWRILTVLDRDSSPSSDFSKPRGLSEDQTAPRLRKGLLLPSEPQPHVSWHGAGFLLGPGMGQVQASAWLSDGHVHPWQQDRG